MRHHYLLGFRDSEPYTETLHTANHFSTHQSLKNFLDHLYQTERFEDLKSALNSVLTEPISRKEILVAILSLPERECLTTGGLTVQFYKHYACKITDLLQAFFNQILDFKPTVESLGHRNCDHTYSHHVQYHCSPVTVIDTDYKILASVLAERLKSVIEHVLSPGVGKPQMSTQDSIIVLQSETAEKIVIVSLGVDAGALNFRFLFYSLKFVNLPDRFTSVLKLLMQEGDANMHSESYSLQSPLKGLKVGCPLTPLLISICLIPLIHSVNSEKRLSGPNIPKAVIDKDNAIIFLPNTSEALESLEKTLLDFTETSGLIIDRRYSV